MKGKQRRLKKNLLKSIDSVLPIKKAQRELFWVKELLKHLPLQEQLYDIISNQDDSNGNHDVLIINKDDGSKVGVQVTELISSTRKRVELIRTRYIQKILKILKKQKIRTHREVVITLCFDTHAQEKYDPTQITLAIEKILALLRGEKVCDASIKEIEDQEKLRLPHANNIALNFHFQQSLRTQENYLNTLKHLMSKKQNSKSPWLLIWSMDFWQDRNTFGDLIVDEMKKLFQESFFEKVYFIESTEFDFDRNIKLYQVK